MRATRAVKALSSLIALTVVSVVVCAEFWAFDVIDLRTGLGVALVVLIVFPALVAAIIWICWFFYNLAQRRWRRAATVLAIPLMVASTFEALQRLGLTAEYADFLTRRAFYEAQVTAASKSGAEEPLLAWSYGDTGGAGVTNVIYTLVYDPSGTIAQPRETWSRAWRFHADRAAKGDSLYGVDTSIESRPRLGSSTGILLDLAECFGPALWPWPGSRRLQMHRRRLAYIRSTHADPIVGADPAPLALKRELSHFSSVSRTATSIRS